MTTDRPYTDTDLRAEAAAQLAALTDDPDYTSVGEAMDCSWVPSVETTEDGSARTWTQLLVDEHSDDPDYTQFETAQRQVHELIRGAAEISEWAINLGADNLQPSPDQITVNGDQRPIARIHFAFDPSMPADAHAALVAGIGEAIADLL